MDPFILLLLILKQKEIINDNEFSWIMNATEMDVNQVKFLSQDGEDRALTLAALRTRSYHEARDEALKQVICSKCKTQGKVRPFEEEFEGQKIKVGGGFFCEHCQQNLFSHQLLTAKKG